MGMDGWWTCCHGIIVKSHDLRNLVKCETHFLYIYNDMNPFGHLSDENDEQLRKYLKFFRHKKEGILRSITREFQDISNDKLTEEMYTKDDVMEYTDFLSSAIVVTDIITLLINNC